MWEDKWIKSSHGITWESNPIKIIVIDRHNIFGKVHNAQCDMKNYVKVHVALHDKVWTGLVFVVNDIHDM